MAGDVVSGAFYLTEMKRLVILRLYRGLSPPIL
jgi:hypothetical protein